MKYTISKEDRLYKMQESYKKMGIDLILEKVIKTQEELDQECIDMMPLVKEAINKARDEDIENMWNISLIEAVNSHVKLVDMTKQELSDFQHCLIKMFKYHGWTK
ncbi:MAG TPA: hypothetical protein VKR58_15130 [Aquella sp.]|nr:hypothetical protein [Aquella sp.]